MQGSWYRTDLTVLLGAFSYSRLLQMEERRMIRTGHDEMGDALGWLDALMVAPPRRVALQRSLGSGVMLAFMRKKFSGSAFEAPAQTRHPHRLHSASPPR
jgi:hypothetical protein